MSVVENFLEMLFGVKPGKRRRRRRRPQRVSRAELTIQKEIEQEERILKRAIQKKKKQKRRVRRARKKITSRR